jgi:O-antigen/teichoic acid export membrane protein
MLAGTVAAQALPLLIAPLLTRLYTPEAFGLQTLFMGLTASLAVLATWRMDVAVVLPESDREASTLVAFVLCAIAAVTVLVALALPFIDSFNGRALPHEWRWMLPLMVAATALSQLSIGLASRRHEFRRVAASNVGNQAGYASVALGIGVAGGWLPGLALAKLVGQLLATLWLAARQFGTLLAAPAHLGSGVAAAVRKYRQFIVFNTPYSLAGSVARDAPVYLFTFLAAVGSAGHFGLARTVLLAPTLLTSNALSQVFFREAVALRGTPRLQQLTLALLRFGLLSAAPLFAFCAIWGDAVFATLFGDGWRTAGVYAMLMAPAAWMSVQTGWPERLFEVSMRQDVSFAVQLGSDLVTALAFGAAYVVTRDAVVAVGVFAVCNVLYHHVYLAAIFRVSGFSGRDLAVRLRRGWTVFAASAAVLGLLRLALGTHAAAWVLALVVAGLAAAAIAWRLARGELLPATMAGGAS